MDYTAWMKTMGCVLIDINKCLPENEEQKIMMRMDLEYSLDPINDELETYYED